MCGRFINGHNHQFDCLKSYRHFWKLLIEQWLLVTYRIHLIDVKEFKNLGIPVRRKISQDHWTWLFFSTLYLVRFGFLSIRFKIYEWNFVWMKLKIYAFRWIFINRFTILLRERERKKNMFIDGSLKSTVNRKCIWNVIERTEQTMRHRKECIHWSKMREENRLKSKNSIRNAYHNSMIRHFSHWQCVF